MFSYLCAAAVMTLTAASVMFGIICLIERYDDNNYK
jgi:hypothetical protein